MLNNLQIRQKQHNSWH